MDSEHLNGIALFDGLTAEQKAEIAQRADTIDIEAGKRLVSAGRYGFEFYVIENGRAQVVREDQHIADLGPGDFFGEMAIAGDTTANADVIAATPMTAMVMTADQFQSLRRRMPEVATAIREACARRSAS